MAIVLLVGGFIILTIGILILVPGLSSKDWPSAQGIILRARVVERAQSRSFVHSIAITYRYEVHGQRYEGNTFSHATDSLPISDRDREKVLHEYQTSPCFSEWQTGQRVSVFYDPANPQDSVLKPGATGLGWGVLVLGLFLLVSGALEWRRIRR